MRRTDWIKHIDESLPAHIRRPSLDGGADKENFRLYAEWLAKHKTECSACKARARTRRANKAARITRQVYADCGLKRVRGALGGVYYE